MREKLNPPPSSSSATQVALQSLPRWIAIWVSKLDPFVSNCTGEITAEEAMRISWFLRCGGYLFGSCWAVRDTIHGRAIKNKEALANPGALALYADRAELQS